VRPVHPGGGAGGTHLHAQRHLRYLGQGFLLDRRRIRVLAPDRLRRALLPYSRRRRLLARPPARPRGLMPRRRALIIGGSLGGLFAAHLLRAAGWDVEVYERIGDDLAGRGAGLGTHDALRDMMARIGLDVVTPLGVATHAYVCRDRTGRP